MSKVESLLQVVRGLVRPAVAVLFSVAQITLAVLWGIPPSVVIVNTEAVSAAFAALVPFTMLIVRDYFDSRPDRSDDH